MSKPPTGISRQKFETSDQEQFINPVSVSYARREVRMHSVTDSELDSIASLGNSVEMTLFGICAGALITLLVTVLTVKIQSPLEFSAFISATIVSFLSTLFFGVRSRSSYKAAQRKLAEIKSIPLAR